MADMTWTKRRLAEILNEDRGLPDEVAAPAAEFTETDLTELPHREREAALSESADAVDNGAVGLLVVPRVREEDPDSNTALGGRNERREVRTIGIESRGDHVNRVVRSLDRAS